MLVNVEEGLGRLRGNAMIYKRMLSMFIDSKEAAQFDDAIATGDIETATRASHSMKGIAGNLSLDDLYAVSDKLTEELRKNIKDDTTIAEFHDVIDQTMVAVKDVIETL